MYVNPTINALTSSIIRFVGNIHDPENRDEHDIRAMHDMVEKYGNDLPVHHARAFPAVISTGEIIVITGTTGRLGAHLLAQLLEKPSVRHVYALNRPSDYQVSERQSRVFQRWGIDTGLLDGKNIMFLDADLSKRRLGLDPHIYDQIRDSATGIIHNGQFYLLRIR